MKSLVAFLAAAVVPTVAPAQTAVVAGGAKTITEADVRRHINLIAHDSMGGRDTPSRGLDLTAQYVAGEFKRLGLKPAGTNPALVTTFPITTRRLLVEGSSLQFTGPGQAITLALGKQVAVLFGRPDSGTSPVTLLGGGIDSATAASLKGQAVVWIADWSRGLPAGAERGVQQLITAGVTTVIMVVNQPAIFANMAGGGPTDQVTVGEGSSRAAVMAVLDSAIYAQVPDAKAQFDQLRAVTTPTAVPAADWSLTATVRDTVIASATAPNVAGMIEGTDPLLKNEYLVFSAHMDHVGSDCKGADAADNVCNGADDDASGTAGLIELAEAFSAPGARPKRSLIFLGVSGEEKGLWGSDVFAKAPPVEIRSIVANFNMDMIGRNWKDTIVAIGMKHSDLGTTLNEVTAAHPDLRLTAVDDLWPDERLYFRSDHYNFALRGVPVLFFTSGLHEDYHAVTDTPDKIDAEKEARILRLVYQLGQVVANRSERPKWNPGSYQAIVQPKDQVP
ncbi:MAG: M20/M25/M40 family metallo-hydrolase [Gemmatimonadales bacterium]